MKHWLTTNWHWITTGAIITARTATLGLSAWPIHQGYVEVFYANIANASTPIPDGVNVLPMRYAPLAWSFAIFGESEWAARFPGMIALTISAVTASGIGGILAGDHGRKWTPVFLVTNPWVQAWYGRAMPDAWLTTSILLIGFVALKSNQRPRYAWLVGPALALGLASKPTALLALGLLIMIRRRDAFLVSLASVTGTILIGSNLATNGHAELLLSRLAQLAALRFGSWETFDVPGMVVSGLLIGCAGIAWLAWARPLSDATLPLYGFLAHTLWYAIPNHAYYALPIAGWASVTATPFLQGKPRLTVVMLSVSLMMVPFALFDTGALGDQRTRIVEAFPLNATVGIGNHLHLGAMFQYYRPDLHFVGLGQKASHVVSSNATLLGCSVLGSKSYGSMSLYAHECPGGIP